jgi:hypothetical protein
VSWEDADHALFEDATTAAIEAELGRPWGMDEYVPDETNPRVSLPWMWDIPCWQRTAGFIRVDFFTPRPRWVSER